MPGDAEINRPAAAVDKRTGTSHYAIERGDYIHDFAGGASGSDDIFDDEGTLAWCDMKASSQRHLAILPLGEQRADTQGASNLVGDDHASESRRNDEVDFTDGVIRGKVRGESLAELFGNGRILQDQGALQVTRAVKA